MLPLSEWTDKQTKKEKINWKGWMWGGKKAAGWVRRERAEGKLDRDAIPSEREHRKRGVLSVCILDTGGQGVQPWTLNHWAHPECLLYAGAWVLGSRQSIHWGRHRTGVMVVTEWRRKKEARKGEEHPSGNGLGGGGQRPRIGQNLPSCKCEWASPEKTRARREVGQGSYSK